jgi:hypothetical protein
MDVPTDDSRRKLRLRAALPLATIFANTSMLRRSILNSWVRGTLDSWLRTTLADEIGGMPTNRHAMLQKRKP